MFLLTHKICKHKITIFIKKKKKNQKKKKEKGIYGSCILNAFPVSEDICYCLYCHVS